jgi:hemoglobin-like flavoprotein
MLTKDEIHLIEDSWDIVIEHVPDIGKIFFERLFYLEPELQDLFVADPDSQARKFTMMITMIVNQIDNIDCILPEVRELGRRHALDYQVLSMHYRRFEEALLWSLEKLLGREWDSAMKSAWTKLYFQIAQEMERGSASAYRGPRFNL